MDGADLCQVLRDRHDRLPSALQDLLEHRHHQNARQWAVVVQAVAPRLDHLQVLQQGVRAGLHLLQVGAHHVEKLLEVRPPALGDDVVARNQHGEKRHEHRHVVEPFLPGGLQDPADQ
eukprot:7929387-Lingulodinium_polyedra.AAC.1